MSSIKQRRSTQRRAESRLFEAIEAADAGDLRLAEQLIARAVTPRRARAVVVDNERVSMRATRAPVQSPQTRRPSPTSS